METFTFNSAAYDAYSDLVKQYAGQVASFNKSQYAFNSDEIDRVEFYPPATKLFLKDGTVVTSVARDGDEFNKETGIIMCILKILCDGTCYNTVVRNLIKDEERRERKKEEEQKKAAEAKEVALRQKEKQKRRRLAREARRREKAIEIQKEAYLRIMKEMRSEERTEE